MPTDAVRPWLPDLRGADMTVTRLSDLLAAEPPVHTVARDALRWHVQAGDDPILYRVDHGVLPPRGPWTADRTTYGPGLLPAGAELVRSLGGWNPPARLVLHQCLTGGIVLLTALPGDPARTLQAQVCRAGDLAVVPPGAWHLTAVVDGPAEVFSVRADVAPHRPPAPRRRPPVQVTAVAGLGGFALTGPDLSPDHPVPTVAAPAALRSLVPPAGLAALHWSGQDEERAELLRVLTAERAAG